MLCTLYTLYVCTLFVLEHARAVDAAPQGEFRQPLPHTGDVLSRLHPQVTLVLLSPTPSGNIGVIVTYTLR